MCGIVYYQANDGTAVNMSVLQRFEAQRLRGTEGFGFFDGHHIFRAAQEKRIKRLLKKERNQSDMILFHHRFPTSTVNERRAAHPFNTGDFFGDVRYVMVHNGMIRNHKQMKEKHEKLGITYQSTLDNGTYNDSESLMWELALVLEGRQETIESYGDMSFIVIKVENDKPSKLYFGRNSGRPLVMTRDKLGMSIASEGEGTVVDVGTLYTYNYDLKRLTNKKMTIPYYDPTYTYKPSTTNTGYKPGYSGYGSAGWDDRDYDDFDRNYGRNYQLPAGGAAATKFEFMSKSSTDPYNEPYLYVTENLLLEDKVSWDPSVKKFYVLFDDGILYDDNSFEFWDESGGQDEDGVWVTMPPGTYSPSFLDDFEDEEDDEDELNELVVAAALGAADKPKEKPLESLGEILERTYSVPDAIKPTSDQIQARIKDELNISGGSYFDAYLNMEARLNDLLDTPNPSVFMRKETELLHQAVNRITDDPQFADETSVHPLYGEAAKRSRAKVAIEGVVVA